MDGPDRDVAVLLTGVGKRYDIVSAFAEHAFVVAADPSPLAPAQYAADVRVAPPRIDDPGYVPFLEQLVDEHGVKAVIPLTDLDIEVLAQLGPAGLRAGAGDLPRDLRQVRDARAAAVARPAEPADGPAGRGAGARTR